MQVPNATLAGRQSKIIVTDYKFGKHTLLYSISEVLTYGTFDVDVLVLYLNEGQPGQFALKGIHDLKYQTYGNTAVTSNSTSNSQTFNYIQGKGQTTIKLSDGTLIYLLDQHSAWQFWAPPTTTNPSVSPSQQIFVLGPYLVRSAAARGIIVQVSGDSNLTSTLEVYTGNPLSRIIQWNGIILPTKTTQYGSLTATIPGTEKRTVSLPALTNWKSANSLPEAAPSYDDSKWTVCNKTTTLSPVAPVTLPVLFSSDYGYYTGAKVYRGYFDGLNATSVTLTTSGGLAFGFNAWLNGDLVGGHPGNATLTTLTSVISFSNATLKSKDNVLTVVVDYVSLKVQTFV